MLEQNKQTNKHGTSLQGSGVEVGGLFKGKSWMSLKYWPTPNSNIPFLWDFFCVKNFTVSQESRNQESRSQECKKFLWWKSPESKEPWSQTGFWIQSNLWFRVRLTCISDLWHFHPKKKPFGLAMFSSLQNYWHIQISEVKDEGRRVGTVKRGSFIFCIFFWEIKNMQNIDTC